MKLGLHLASTTWEGSAPRLGPTLAPIVQTAEAAGFGAISVTDHVWGSQYTGGVEANQIEAYTTFGFIAAHTQCSRLLAFPARRDMLSGSGGIVGPTGGFAGHVLERSAE